MDGQPQLVVEWLSLPLLLDRRGKGMTRSRNHIPHTRYVLAVRRWFIPLCGGTLPKWEPVGLRTVYPRGNQ